VGNSEQNSTPQQLEGYCNMSSNVDLVLMQCIYFCKDSSAHGTALATCITQALLAAALLLLLLLLLLLPPQCTPAAFPFPIYDGTSAGVAQLVRCIPDPNAQDCNSAALGTFNLEVYGAAGERKAWAGISSDAVQFPKQQGAQQPSLCETLRAAWWIDSPACACMHTCSGTFLTSFTLRAFAAAAAGTTAAAAAMQAPTSLAACVSSWTQQPPAARPMLLSTSLLKSAALHKAVLHLLSSNAGLAQLLLAMCLIVLELFSTMHL
jgi:hypothetical protein